MNTNLKNTGGIRISQIKTNYTPTVPTGRQEAFGVLFIPISAIRVIILVLLVPLCFLIFGCDTKQPPPTKALDPPQTAISNKAPDFTLKDLTGKKVKLSDLVGQKPLVLDFWASWCPSCRTELPKMVKLYNNCKDKINIVGINLDRTLENAQKYTKEHNVPYPNLYDENGKVVNLYGIFGIPALVIINSQGEIIKHNASLEDVNLLPR